jgi:UDP-N-acetylglucosamine--N-acetylmuramyl-(pentapeptide) pyrophosphoryl-undecaprenol N-acetylglucosamine transferase
MKGCMEARRVLKKLKPDLVFSKGGFVSVPVILAAKSLRIPIFIHESDMTPGLANTISKRFATKIYTSFEETKKFFPESKTMVVGSPIRREVFNGSKEKAGNYLSFHNDLPILTIMGGSLGAKKINAAVRNSLKLLTAKYQVVHLCGKNNIDTNFSTVPGYKQFEYVHEELPDILAATDLVITRGGSNAIFEFLALNIPMLIIPLSLQQSRGDQILNAKAFEEKGYSITLAEENLTSETLIEYVKSVQKRSAEFRRNMKHSQQGEALQTLVNEMNKTL